MPTECKWSIPVWSALFSARVCFLYIYVCMTKWYAQMLKRLYSYDIELNISRSYNMAIERKR